MKKQSLSEMIYEDLKKRIICKEFKKGEKLPSERLLAEHYSVSRIPVREALNRLAEEEILQISGSKRVVADIPTVSSSDDIPADSPLNNSEVFLETIRLRTLIESEATKQAAQNASPDGLDRIQQAFFESIAEVRKLKNGEENNFYAADLKFHRIIAIESGNPFFIKCLDEIPHILYWQQTQSLNQSFLKDEVISYHTMIFDALIDRDGEKAYQAMHEHLSRVETLITSANSERT